jgi:hypothetical protein
MHAAEIERAFAEKTGAALDVMPKNTMAVAERPVRSGSVDPKIETSVPGAGRRDALYRYR